MLDCPPGTIEKINRSVAHGGGSLPRIGTACTETDWTTHRWQSERSSHGRCAFSGGHVALESCEEAAGNVVISFDRVPKGNVR